MMTTWFRIALFAAAAACLSTPAVATAQMGGAASNIPLGMDPRKVAVGAYGDYEMTTPGMAPVKMRLALVGREGQNNVIETTIEGGMMAMMGGKMTAKMVLDKDLAATGKAIMQLSQGDPMEVPMNQPGAAPAAKLQMPNPKDLIGNETVKVKAGTFKTKHYRTKNGGGTADMWFSDQVPPFGLVRMVGVGLQASAGGPQNVSMELLARGKNAKPTITKPAKPFDPSIFTRGLGAPPAK